LVVLFNRHLERDSGLIEIQTGEVVRNHPIGTPCCKCRDGIRA
jgi:hypothetical protein